MQKFATSGTYQKGKLVVQKDKIRETNRYETSSEKAGGQDREHHVGEEETNKDHHGNSNSTSG